MRSDRADVMRIAILMGGVSSERDVSLKSGRAVAQALSDIGHVALPVDITSEDIAEVVNLRPDVAFIALHGRFGEDGGVQAMLESAGIPYTGSDSQASRLAMDKMSSKCLFISNDVPTPDFRVLMSPESDYDAAAPQDRHCRLDEAIEELGLPVVIKPLREGSSVGVSIVESREEAAAAEAAAFEFDRYALAEKYVEGRELTVGILGNQALPIVEISYSGKIFDHDAKYRSATTLYTVNPDLGQWQTARIQDLALRAHSALGCSGFSRVDVRLDALDLPYVLEVNTIPGFTSRSLFPMAARAAGIEFTELCDRLAHDALLTHLQTKVTALAG